MKYENIEIYSTKHQVHSINDYKIFVRKHKINTENIVVTIGNRYSHNSHKSYDLKHNELFLFLKTMDNSKKTNKR